MFLLSNLPHQYQSWTMPNTWFLIQNSSFRAKLTLPSNSFLCIVEPRKWIKSKLFHIALNTVTHLVANVRYLHRVVQYFGIQSRMRYDVRFVRYFQGWFVNYAWLNNLTWFSFNCLSRTMYWKLKPHALELIIEQLNNSGEVSFCVDTDTCNHGSVKMYPICARYTRNDLNAYVTFSRKPKLSETK